ncbi:MAG: DUF4954 family protein [Planctomycetota bacterium]|jgi:hypothetical protein
MTGRKSYKALAKEQIKALETNGCTAEDWKRVFVADGFDPARVRNTDLLGQVNLGNLTGKVKSIHGLEKPCGIYNAIIADCTVGDHTRIANIGVHIAGYDIADSVCIENVATMQTRPGASFGNGVEIDVLNEASGREVILFDQLSVQFAYIMCLHRYRPKLIEKLKAIAADYIRSVTSDRGTVATGVCICSTPEIVDVNFGPYAKINGASSLVNGTILSSQDAVTTVGAKVVAENFIISESSSVTGGAILDNVFVGQGCLVGKQYSAENSLFFANCEAFHGEGCSVFAGPYSVTHHKSSLLIAGLFSFYNAGSGTNQSNHMYKLGPVHEGKLQRGTKTGSFSYMMWPCRTGPFSVILGKHTGTFDTSDFPFSHLDSKPDGRCAMVPGLHLTTVGTVRDGAKWPSRDRRKGSVKRDIISFDVFSPYTIGKMLKANAILKSLQEKTDKSIEEIAIGGAIVKRLMLRMSQKYYNNGIQMYLLEKVIEKAEKALAEAKMKMTDAFVVDADAVYSDEWLDIGGQLMPRQRLLDLEEAIENGTICTIESFAAAMEKIDQAYQIDEWLWVRKTYKQVFDVDLEDATKDDILNAAKMFLKVKSRFFKLVIVDAQKEFSELSHYGFGQDGTEKDIVKDLCQVRGLYEDNKFVREMNNNVEELQKRIEEFEQKISSL